MEKFKKAMLILTISILLSFSRSVGFSWSGHGAYTYLLLRYSNLNLDFLVEVKPKNFDEKRLYNRMGKLDRYLNEPIVGVVKLRNMESEIVKELENIHSSLEEPAVDNKIPAIKIISLYASFPDIGIDYLRNVSWLQDALLGDSQALRHGKIKVGPIEIFEADQSFLYFIRKSRELLKAGNTYWGLRFLGCALHYLQDIMQPYHVKPGTVYELISYIFDKNVRNLLSNLHRAYDDILMYLMLHDAERFRKVVEQAKPIYFSSYETLIHEVFMYSYFNFFKVHELQKIVFSDFIHKRHPSMKDFLDKKDDPYFKKLVDETYSIVSTMSGVIKGLLETHLKNLKN